GLMVHLTTYFLVRSILIAEGLSFMGFSIAVLAAIETAIIFNFILNNLWTFREQRLRGAQALTGILKFNIACALGAAANYSVAAFLFSRGTAEILSVMAGAFVGIFWNYTMNRLITWRE
ncbi:MAG: GtrA family protein, partial [Patescibacteria group bacterium]